MQSIENDFLFINGLFQTFAGKNNIILTKQLSNKGICVYYFIIF